MLLPPCIWDPDASHTENRFRKVGTRDSGIGDSACVQGSMLWEIAAELFQATALGGEVADSSFRCHYAIRSILSARGHGPAMVFWLGVQGFTESSTKRGAPETPNAEGPQH